MTERVPKGDNMNEPGWGKEAREALEETVQRQEEANETKAERK
jgi:hypothetical protein